MTDHVLTLGGLRPGSVIGIVPGDGQMRWRPCLHRSEGSADAHAWFLSATSDGSLHCWDCRLRVPRAVMGPHSEIAKIRVALEAGDRTMVDELVRALSWTSAPSIDPAPFPVPVSRFTPRDHADWDEFFGERAAIFEYLGGFTRDVAEAMAHALAGPPPKFGAVGPLFAGAT